MLDFGFAELFVIIALAVIVIGPKELPIVMVTLGRIVRRLQYIRYIFTSQFEEFMEDADLKGMRTSVNFEAKGFEDAEFDEAAFDEAQADEEEHETERLEES